MSTPTPDSRRQLSLPKRLPHESDFTGRFHDEMVTARVGLALGVAFALCFVTGILSHLIQHPLGWFAWPTRPVNLYRVTQGVHVLSGIAAIPLLLVKLYTVYPKLFAFPRVRSAVHAVERGTVFVLVAAAFFELYTGLLNIAHWYPWPFPFVAMHYAIAWVALGSILLHVAVKLPTITRALRAPLDDDDAAVASPGPNRRSFLAATGLGVGAVVLATAGATVPWLRRVSVLAVRTGHGPQGVPVNKTALSAGVTDAATDPQYRLTLVGPTGEVRLSLAQLSAMPQFTSELPIACVEGWSASASWTGVRIVDLMSVVGATADHDLRFVSIQDYGTYSRSVLPAAHARDPLSLLALRINHEVLDLDHGYPCRLITASRPGVLQTKWVSRIEVIT